MLTTTTQLAEAAALDAIDLIATDCIENVLHNDFLQHLSDYGEARVFKNGGIDYSVSVDVTDHLPDLGVNPWFEIGYKANGWRDVYMVCVGREVICGRDVWSWVAEFCDGLPVKGSK
jgi:hypothetical protein